MNPLMLFRRAVRWLWQVSMLLRYPFDSGLRTGSRVAGLYMFLVLLFVGIGIILSVLGVDLGAVDRWLDDNGSWIERLASFAFNAFWSLIFLFSLAAAGIILFELFQVIAGRRGADLDQPEAAENLDEEPQDTAPRPGPAGLGCAALAALLVAYFAWFGMTG